MPVLPTPSLAATLSLALLGASCSLTTDLSGLQQGTGAGVGGGSSTTSTSSSAPAECGDGFIQGEEECDDNNAVPGDGCASCVVECGGEGEVKSPAFHCYKFYGIEVYDFGFATYTCANSWRKNAALVTVTSEAELDFLVSMHITQDGTWLGATDKNSTGKFQWVTGEPWDYDWWADGFPKDIGQQAHCSAFMPPLLRWQNTSCEEGKHLICELSPLGKPAP